MNSKHPRRQFFRTLFQHSVLMISTGLAACGGRSSTTEAVSGEEATGGCDDLSGLSEQDLQLRQTYGYLPESPVAGNQCDNCNLWLPNQADPSCGKCLLFKGPVFAVGHCTSWAPQT